MRNMILAVFAVFGVAVLSTASAGDIDDLDFMTGVWRWESPTGPVEEWWMPAAGNTKIAAFRWVRNKKIIAIELVIISEEEDGTFLRFKHYGADFVPWEKDEPNIYKLISAENDKAEFHQTSNNPKVPPVIIYEGTGSALIFRGTRHPETESYEGDLVLTFEGVESQ